MAFCAWCGKQVAQVSYAPCPACGNPSNGAQRVAGGASAGSKTAGIVIGIVVGGFVLLAIVGILAAIAIPNFINATQRSKQKRSMADMRSIATAVEAYAVDRNEYPRAASVAELSPALVPKYLAAVPELDGWGTPLRYECWERDGQCAGYAIGSAGKDKTFEQPSLRDYAEDTATSTFDADLVYANGKFVQYPEGAQR